MIRLTAKGLKRSRVIRAQASQVAAKLSEQSAAMMLNAYMDLPPKGQGEQYAVALERVRKLFGKTADRDDVASALQELDASVGAYLSDSIDEAWHTAWAVREAGRSLKGS